MKLKDAYSLESYDKPRQNIKKQRHYFVNKGSSSQGYGVSSGHVWMWELNCEESWSPKNWCFWTVVLEKTLRVPWTARRSNQSVLKEISPGVHWKDWCWSWNSNTLATWCKELTHLERLWCWERSRAGGKGDNREWDCWMASPTQWTRVWVNSGSWWQTGRPGMLRFMGSQRVGHDWATELNRNSKSQRLIPVVFYVEIKLSKERVQDLERINGGFASPVWSCLFHFMYSGNLWSTSDLSAL